MFSCQNYKGTSQLQSHIFTIKCSFWVFVYINLRSHNRRTKKARHNLEWKQKWLSKADGRGMSENVENPNIALLIDVKLTCKIFMSHTESCLRVLTFYICKGSLMCLWMWLFNNTNLHKLLFINFRKKCITLPLYAKNCFKTKNIWDI